MSFEPGCAMAILVEEKVSHHYFSAFRYVIKSIVYIFHFYFYRTTVFLMLKIYHYSLEKFITNNNFTISKLYQQI
ncbi:MAG: hypothetical protein A2033_10515 [Bacteroidetes bacterium GWA2_31_9]|nr:MAG: hypothetical protein A2033_10515 [Bacteroidetes bacterium GWA2_31_9]